MFHKKKAIVAIIIICFAFLSIFIYNYNDGFLRYQIQKRTTSSINIIKYYTSIQFPNETKIEKIKYDKYKDEEVLQAVLLVPNGDIDKLFKEKSRDYKLSHIPERIIMEQKLSNICFSTIQFNTVRNWSSQTQRDIHFIIFNRDKTYTKVYVYINMLGWHMWNSPKLGGTD